jgi:hypothetical protein
VHYRCVVEGAGEIGLGKGGGQLDQGAGNRRDGDAAPDCAVTWVEVRLSACNVLDASLGGGGHLGLGSLAPDQFPEPGGRKPAQHSTFSACSNSG